MSDPKVQASAPITPNKDDKHEDKSTPAPAVTQPSEQPEKKMPSEATPANKS